MTVAVCATGLASTSSTPGRRDNTASATFFELAHWTPETSRTAVDCLLVMPLHSAVALILGALAWAEYTLWGYVNKRTRRMEEYRRALAVIAVFVTREEVG